MKKLIAGIALASGILVGTFVVAPALQQPRQPVCIVVHANGAPAPGSCNDPNSYQVTP
jgi:hypothetical protein